MTVVNGIDDGAVKGAPNGRRPKRLSFSPTAGQFAWIKPAAFLLVVAGIIWAASAQFSAKADRTQVEILDRKVGDVRDQVHDLSAEVRVIQTEQRIFIRAIRPDLGGQLGGQ